MSDKNERSKLRWFNESKGFWFYYSSRRKQRRIRSIFLPFKVTVSKTLAEGQNVEFTIENGAKGPAAANVTVAS